MQIRCMKALCILIKSKWMLVGGRMVLSQLL